MPVTLKHIKLCITIGWPLLAGAATLLGAYKALIYEGITQRHLIQENYKSISQINSAVTSINLSDKNLKINLAHDTITIALLNDKVKDISANLKNNTDYQQILRVEVKELAEQKLNVSEFWHYIKLMNFEEGQYYVGHSYSKS